MSDLSPIDRARAIQARERGRKVMAELRESGPPVGLRSPSACLPEVREMLERIIDRRPEEARAAFAAACLRLWPNGPIGWRESDERKLAWLRALDIAVEVRCKRRCSHPATIAVLPLGVLACADCVVELSDGQDANPRRGCDVCGLADPATRTTTQLGGGLVVIAEVCGACLVFHDGLPDG